MATSCVSVSTLSDVSLFVGEHTNLHLKSAADQIITQLNFTDMEGVKRKMG